MQEQEISHLTRTKLARELVFLPNQRRGAPCLRKLVLWSNLLGTRNYNDPSHFNYQQLTSVLSSHSTPCSIGLNRQVNHLERNHPLQTGLIYHHHHHHHNQQQNEAEFDWFEHLMDEIDDSDSESDSSDHTPDQLPTNQPEHASLSSKPHQELVLKPLENSPLTQHNHADQFTGRSKRARPSDIDQTKGTVSYCLQANQLGRRTRRRLLSISIRSRSNPQYLPRKQPAKYSRKKSSVQHPSSSAPIPYWGFITPQLALTKLTQIIRPPSSSFFHGNNEDEEDDGLHSLPSLLSIKSSYLFKSIDPMDNTSQIVQNHDFRREDASASITSRSAGEPELNSIDFSPYDFLVSTTTTTTTTTTTSSHDQDQSILQVKYLIGNLGKFRRENPSHLTTNHDDGKHIHIRIGKQQRRHHFNSSSSHGLVVKKLCVAFNHLLDFSQSNCDLYHGLHFHSQYCHPNSLHSVDQHLLSSFRSKASTFAWKVYGLHRS